MHILIVLAVCFAASGVEAARVPKVYNALITSDDNLTPSQAYPFVQTLVRHPFGGYAAYPQHPLIVGPAPSFVPQKPRFADEKPKEQSNEKGSSELELQDEATIKPKGEEDKKEETEVKPTNPHILPQTPQLTPLTPVHFPGSIYPLDPVFNPYSGWSAATPDLFYPPLPYYHQGPVFIDLSHITPEMDSKLNSNHKSKEAALAHAPLSRTSKTAKETQDQTPSSA